MANGQWPLQSKRLGENITLLSLLAKKVPSPPSSNPIVPSQSRGSSTRSFSFNRECILASSLAFLTRLSDQPNDVIALALEEVSSPRAIKVVIAINKQEPGDGEDVLDGIKLGFETIFRILSRVTLDSDGRVEGDVFSAIISMTRRQILLRVGSGRLDAVSTTRQKSFFGDNIQTVIDAVRRRSNKRRGQYAEQFLEKAAILKHSLDALEICSPDDVDSKLKEVVTVASRLNRAMDVSQVLQGISTKVLETSTRDGFVRRLGKIARYLECAQHLYQTAKNLDLFDNATVVSVALTQEYLARNPTSLDNPNFSECLSRCKTKKPLNLNQLCQKLHTTEAAIAREFVSEATEAYNESKIHAEIQILAHYELNDVQPPPRVICSSKDACYLCNAFVRLHGMFHIPASHGRLYPAWRLPELQAFHKVQEKLNRSLETQILLQGRKLLGSAKRAITTYPNESTIMPFSTSLSTILSFAGSGHEEQTPGPLNIHDQVIPSETRQTSLPSILPHSSPQLPLVLPSGLPSREEPSPTVDETDHSAHVPPPSVSGDPIETITQQAQSASIDSTPKRSPPTDSDIALIRGQPMTLTVGRRGHPCSYTAGGLTVFPELPRGRGRAGPGTVMSIEWLSDYEGLSGVVDAGSMPESVDLDSGSPDCVLIACGRDVVRIRVRPSQGRGPESSVR